MPLPSRKDADDRQQLTHLIPWLTAWVRRKWPLLDSDDVVQETYLRLLKMSPAEIKSGPALLMRVARSVAIDQIRRAKVRSICVSFDARGHDGRCSQPLADERVIARQRLEAVAKKLDTLPERHRQVVTLRRLQGLSTRRVAEELGLSVSSVEKMLTASMRLLAPLR